MPAQTQKQININQASEQELAEVPQIGRERAQRIVQERPFKSWEELQQKVPGIGAGMVENMQQTGFTLEE